MRKKEINLKLSSLFTTLCCILGLFWTTASRAQQSNKPTPPPPTSPSDCVQGCTSNDVQIHTAYLSDAAGVKLPLNFVCPGTGTASVYLTLELTTNTPRVGVTIFTKIKNFTPPSTIGSEVSGSPVKQCFGQALDQPLNKVTFTSPFLWTCGTAIVLTDIFIGWGTGNTNFCTSNNFQCPGTPSKCYSLPPGSFVAIETPNPATASSTLCSETAGSYLAHFDLTALEGDIISNPTNYDFTFYTDADLAVAHQIGTPANYEVTTSSALAYAKVCDKTTHVCGAAAQITLTVKEKPAAPVLSKLDNCDGTTTITAKDASNNVIAASDLTWSNGANTNPISVTTTTAVTATVTVNGCTSASSNSITPAPKTTPAAPVLSKVDNCDGTTTITAKDGSNNVIAAGELTWSNGANTNPISVTTTTAVTATRTVNGCTSGNSNSITPAPKSTPGKPDFTITEPSLCGPSTGTLTICQSVSGYDYTIGATTKAGTGSSLSFTGLSAGSNPQLVVSNTGGVCPSGNFTCTDAVGSCSSATNRASVTSENITQNQTTVKAYPNPFSDKINFVVTTSSAGQGNLEVFNFMGQKIKTVYTGFIPVGTQTFELNLPAKQIANLVYVLRIGNTKTTGKLLQLNR